MNSFKEHIEQLEEMPGANMDTRKVHQHLKKSGWALTRTSGGHDVYTHPQSPKHIAVPRHKQLKAPLVRGIMKDAQINEDGAIAMSPTNNVGGGEIAALGTGRFAEPGIQKRKKFAGSTVFTVPTKNFVMAKMMKRKYAKFEQYLGDPIIAKEIAEYANKNWSEGIVLEDEQTGAMCYLRYGKGN